MDIREILAAIDKQDRELWANCRTQMRKVYMNAHNKIIGLEDWSAIDDAFMDMIDIQLAELFDRSGRISATKPLINADDVDKIKDDLNKRDDEIKGKLEFSPIMEQLVADLTKAKNESKWTLVSDDDKLTEVPNNEWK